MHYIPEVRAFPPFWVLSGFRACLRGSSCSCHKCVSGSTKALCRVYWKMYPSNIEGSTKNIRASFESSAYIMMVRVES